jgi:hypothetical protein
MNQILPIASPLMAYLSTIDGLEHRIDSYKTDDIHDDVVDNLTDEIAENMLAMIALPVSNSREAAALIQCLIRYLDFPKDESEMHHEDKITSGILCGVRKYLAGQ